MDGLGYLERRPDPADGRARLVCLTEAGRGAIGEGRFAELCDSLQSLLDQLDPDVRKGYRAGA